MSAVSASAQLMQTTVQKNRNEIMRRADDSSPRRDVVPGCSTERSSFHDPPRAIVGERDAVLLSDAVEGGKLRRDADGIRRCVGPLRTLATLAEVLRSERGRSLWERSGAGGY